jgi:two-component system sensor histidine kinase KdpD
LEKQKTTFSKLFPISLRDFFTTAIIFALAWGICMLLHSGSPSDGFASPVFVLAVLLVSRLTTGYLFGLVASVLGVICVNFMFTYPYWQVNFTLTGYPLSFMVFLSVSIITCTLTTQLKQQEQLRAESIKEKMRANLLRSVSHDIRTPLTSIAGATSALIDNPSLPEETRKQLLEDVRDDAQWLIRVVENLLSITRMGDEQAKITKSLEAPEDIIAETLRKFRKRFPHVQVTTEIPDDPLFIPMDPILIEQVLSNFLENAMNHGKTTSHIHIAVQEEKSYARFSVTDNGCGISSEALHTLFDGTLKHSETTTGDGKRNMGLGLSVCLAIIRAHDGTMDARNLDPGAEFYFRLPMQEEQTL